MERPCLNDPNEFPDEAVLARQLGPAKAAWDTFMELLKDDYHDGKSWLFKVTCKAKTVCWVSVWDKFFKAGFYFTAKAENAIRQSALAAAIKENFLHSAWKGTLRPVTIEARKISDLKAIRELIGIKLKIK
jgi:hypothetical protein